MFSDAYTHAGKAYTPNISHGKNFDGLVPKLCLAEETLVN